MGNPSCLLCNNQYLASHSPISETVSVHPGLRFCTPRQYVQNSTMLAYETVLCLHTMLSLVETAYVLHTQYKYSVRRVHVLTYYAFFRRKCHILRTHYSYIIHHLEVPCLPAGNAHPLQECECAAALSQVPALQHHHARAALSWLMSHSPQSRCPQLLLVSPTLQNDCVSGHQRRHPPCHIL